MRVPDPFRVARARRLPEYGPRILFFSGGTALRKTSRRLKLTTHKSVHVITPFDSGGSSARLRETFRMLSIGDLRNRLVALADETVHGNPAVYRLFSHRMPRDQELPVLRRQLRDLVEARDPLVAEIPEAFRRIIQTHLRGMMDRHLPPDFDLRGASIGNLLLASGFLDNDRHIGSVLFLFSQLVEARGRVLPVTDADLELVAKLESGDVIVGQHRVTGKDAPRITERIVDLWLSAPGDRRASPVRVDADPDVLRHVGEADLICYPMGSFYSSVIANLLPTGVGRAIAGTGCPKVYVPNLDCDLEQAGHTLVDQVDQLVEFVRRDAGPETPIRQILDLVLIEETPGAYSPGVTEAHLDAIRDRGIQVVETALMSPLGESSVERRIDPDRLVEALLSLA